MSGARPEIDRAIAAKQVELAHKHAELAELQRELAELYTRRAAEPDEVIATFSTRRLPEGYARQSFNALCARLSKGGDARVRKVGRLWVAERSVLEGRALRSVASALPAAPLASVQHVDSFRRTLEERLGARRAGS